VSEIIRTVVIRSIPLPRRTLRIFAGLEDMYRDMVEQLVSYAIENKVKSYIRLRALRYEKLRIQYPQLPSHYIYTSCRDASTRVRSFLKLKRKHRTEKERPEVRKISIWLDDHLWKFEGTTSVKIATHEGWIMVELLPHKQYWRYINNGWKVASEAMIRLDKRKRRIVVYLALKKEVEEYQPRDYLPIDVNENLVSALIDNNILFFETRFRDITLGYCYRRKRLQERYDKIYGPKSRRKRRIMKKIREKKKKNDLRWKLGNIIARTAKEKRLAIVMENLGKVPAESMTSRIKDRQLRHRIFQASFKGVQNAIEEKSRENGVPVLYVNPRNTSKICPLHSSKIVYHNGRVGICPIGGEKWNRDAVSVINLYLRARLGDVGNALSPVLPKVDGSPVPLGSTAAHDPTLISYDVWARWKTLDGKKSQTDFPVTIQVLSVTSQSLSKPPPPPRPPA